MPSAAWVDLVAARFRNQNLFGLCQELGFLKGRIAIRDTWTDLGTRSTGFANKSLVERIPDTTKRSLRKMCCGMCAESFDRKAEGWPPFSSAKIKGRKRVWIRLHKLIPNRQRRRNKAERTILLYSGSMTIYEGFKFSQTLLHCGKGEIAKRTPFLTIEVEECGYLVPEYHPPLNIAELTTYPTI